VASDCPHANRTNHENEYWDHDTNPATGQQEPWRRYVTGYTTCDDCGDRLAVLGPIYDAPRW
jgi:hypothetical protein